MSYKTLCDWCDKPVHVWDIKLTTPLLIPYAWGLKKTLHFHKECLKEMHGSDLVKFIGGE